ncbi:MAG TPA: shikimate dehydrogenase [Candidatus Binatus sp.]|nr:shikimate dehydrogenase [Candidatus Binatus sp.]
MAAIGRDKICAVVAAESSGSMWNQLTRAVRHTRTVELRLDWLRDEREIHVLLQRLATKQPRATLIATCRRRQAGGRFRGPIASQLLVLAQALRAGCAWYDLEIESSSKCTPELLNVLLGAGRRIASAHFFRSSPANQRRVVADLWKVRPQVIKIAANCGSLSAGVKLLGLARLKRNTIVIPMGDVVLPLRCLSLRAGSALTYAPVENATAPGQVSLDALKHLFKVDQISGKTRVYGVIGNPIVHSLSPQLQNAGFQAHKMDAVYFPFLVHDLRDFLGAVKPLGIRGFSVTLPHKQKILRYLDSCDPLAAAIGAVNTVVVNAAGNLCGYNTDYVGVLRALQERLTLSQSRVLILGAGGAARAVAFALAQSGTSVCICARRPKEAKKLAQAVSGQEVPRSELKSEFFDAIINATPVGMYRKTENSPLAAHELNCRLVFDLIYRPVKTKLLQLASRRGIETVSGLEMFLAQGTAQWEIWTSQRAPAAAMRKAVLQALRAETGRLQAKP